MTFINYAAREISCKIVYYGPGLGGKTSNLQHVYDSTIPALKGKFISLNTETDRTLFFDFLPLEAAMVKGFKIRLHLYTVPGQVFYDASRRLLLKGVDGLVFVADSQQERLDANLESILNLQENLKKNNFVFKEIPYVLQLNKRDLKTALPVDELTAALQQKDEAVIEAVATTGTGVWNTLQIITKLVVAEMRKQRRGVFPE